MLISSVTMFGDRATVAALLARAPTGMRLVAERSRRPRAPRGELFLHIDAPKKTAPDFGAHVRWAADFVDAWAPPARLLGKCSRPRLFVSAHAAGRGPIRLGARASDLVRLGRRGLRVDVSLYPRGDNGDEAVYALELRRRSGGRLLATLIIGHAGAFPRPRSARAGRDAQAARQSAADAEMKSALAAGARDLLVRTRGHQCGFSLPARALASLGSRGALTVEVVHGHVAMPGVALPPLAPGRWR